MDLTDTRYALQLARELLTGRQSGEDAIRQTRKWLQWDRKDDWAALFRLFEHTGTAAHGEWRRAISYGQVESKLWLIETLMGILPRDRKYRFHVVGGWLGTLPYLLRRHAPELVESVEQIDIDPSANEIAELLNPEGFRALDRNALDFEYGESEDIVINTACEHFTPEQFSAWLSRVPAGRIVVLQSNNFFSDPDHVNCHYSVFKFRKSLPLRTCLYTGELDLERYKRFMVIGTLRNENV